MIQLELSNRTELRLKQVMLLHTDKDSFFNKMIDYQISELKLGIYNIEKDLKQFEKKYAMNTKLFYKKFESGEIGDEDDYMIWSGIYEMYLRDNEKLEKLQW
jgi:ribosomal protein S24E